MHIQSPFGENINTYTSLHICIYPSLTPQLFVCCCPIITGTFFGVTSLNHSSLASYNHPVPQEFNAGYEIQTRLLLAHIPNFYCAFFFQ